MVMDETLEKIRDVIVETVHPDKIILFGSRARGTNREDSDYDIFILKDGITNERTVIGNVDIAFFENHVKENIDLVAANPEKFEKHKDTKLRVGYVSSDFRSHPVAYFLMPIFRNHDKEQFDVICYYNGNSED